MILWEIPEEEAIAAIDREIEALWDHPQSRAASLIVYGPAYLERRREWDRRNSVLYRERHRDEYRRRNRERMRRKRGYYERHEQAEKDGQGDGIIR